MKVTKVLFSLVLIAAFLVSCTGQAPAPTKAPEAPQASKAAPAQVQPTQAAQPTKAAETSTDKKGKICIILDSGGVDDKGYNQSAWEGAQQAAKELNWDAIYLVSAQQTDWEKNINELLKSKCSLISAVGYVGADALKAAAVAHPEQPFQIIDSAFDPVIPNVWAQLYAMEQGSYLAGYLAAGVSKSQKIGAFGGMNIPPVADFFIGFEEGINYYNTKHNTKVKFYGWSNEKMDGTFVGNFNDTEAAKRLTENMMDEGADIILPQSGVEALAASAAMKQRGGVMAIGADADQFLADKASGQVYLTTIMKQLNISIVEAAKAVAGGTFKGGTYTATLATGGLKLAPFHDYDSAVSADLKAELEQIQKDIASGKIVVNNWASLSKKK
jgi:basic membrane protein A